MRCSSCAKNGEIALGRMGSFDVRAVDLKRKERKKEK